MAKSGRYSWGRYDFEESDSHVYARAKSLCDNLGCYLDHISAEDEEEEMLIDNVVEDLNNLRQMLVSKLGKSKDKN